MNPVQSQEPDFILFGGAFDPPHDGHRNCIQIVKHRFPKAEICVVPSLITPATTSENKTATASFDDRMAMCKIAFWNLEVQTLDVEKYLPAPSYTVQTLEHLSKQYPNKHFGFVMGLDQLKKFPSWLEPLKILEMASLILIPRDNLDFKTAFLEMSQKLGISVDRIKDFHVEFEEYRTAFFIPQATTPISSTELRERLSSGVERTSGIDREVLRYIVSKHLYVAK